jgi:hypothetical protein
VAPLSKGRGANPGDLAQFGSDADWHSLAGLNYSMLLTKTDGTLWIWGPEDRDYFNSKKPWPGLSHFTPRRAGTDSDWAEVRQIGSKPWLKKKDGTFYSTDNWGIAQLQGIAIETNLIVFPVPDVNSDQTPNMITLYYMYSERLRVDPDGVFRIVAGQQLQRGPRGGNYNTWTWVPKNLPIGQGTNWLAAAGEPDEAVTLKKDGTLWLWQFRHGQYAYTDSSESEIIKTIPVQLGTHSDWIAIADYNGHSVVALAADGSLWYWPLAWQPYYYSDDQERPLHVSPILDLSHKPQLLGNVFDAGS